MTKSILIIFCVFCVATVLSEVVGIGLLWSRGQLTSETFGEIRLILAGGVQETVEKDDEVDRAQPSSEDVTRQRSLAILNLSAREEQLGILNGMIEQNRKKLLEDEKAFQSQRVAFEQKLTQEKNLLNDQSTVQARGILLAMPPADAVNHLMELDLKQCVVLMKDMPEKKAAVILQEFFIATGPQNVERIKRGHDILIAIGAGQPERAVIDAANSPPQAATETSGTPRN